jgi:hypothetical protein
VFVWLFALRSSNLGEAMHACAEIARLENLNSPELEQVSSAVSYGVD